jgi:alanine racemase
MPFDIKRPAWVKIDLDNFRYNLKSIKNHIKIGTQIMAIIKADAYGHGALGMIDVLKEEGIDRVAVAILLEALEIREKDTDINIMLLGYTPDENLEEVIKNNITPTIYSFEQAKYLDELAKKNNKRVTIHVKIDTGMHRVGLDINESSVEEIKKISTLENIFIEGIYTHFATADEIDKSYTRKQVENYQYIVNRLEEEGVNIPIKHVSNSAATVDLGEYNFDMVRPGLIMYGLYPSEDQKSKIDLKPVMSLHSKIFHIKTLKKEEGIGYGLTYTAKTDLKTAVIPLGYADGYFRGLSNKGEVLIGGKKAKIIGNICMDKFMIDITDLDVKTGDEVILFGEENPIDELAKILGTINYELVCAMSKKRVPRIYSEK